MLKAICALSLVLAAGIPMLAGIVWNRWAWLRWLTWLQLLAVGALGYWCLTYQVGEHQIVLKKFASQTSGLGFYARVAFCAGGLAFFLPTPWRLLMAWGTLAASSAFELIVGYVALRLAF